MRARPADVLVAEHMLLGALIGGEVAGIPRASLVTTLDAPLVLASLSSSFMNQRAQLERIAEALGTLPVRGLLTTGPAMDPAAVRAPGNVLVTAAAPHNTALRHAAVTITHAGHGTAVKSLAAGVPLVCVPLGRDQIEVARHVELAGAGIAVSKNASPRTIARAVDRVLTPRARAWSSRSSLGSSAARSADGPVARCRTPVRPSA
ncbi:glycosyltransferase [Microbispora siamensis]